MNFLYELLLKIISIARGYILCPAGSLQNNTYQNRKAPFEESGTETSSEADRQRTKGRRYRFIRIVFIIFIILLCLILAVASPLRCFALGYASETIVELILSALAGTAAYTFAAAGGAELIACLCIGMAASITVSTIAAAINTAVECGAWSDFVANCQGNFEVRKEKGMIALAMGGTAFLYAYDWVKEHILGIKSGEDDSDSSLPALSKLTEVGSVSEACQTFYDKSYHPEVKAKFSDKLSFLDSWNIVDGSASNRASHNVKIFSDDKNYIELVTAQAQLDMDCNFSFGINVGAPGTLKFSSYLPIIQKDKILTGAKIIQLSDKGTRKALEEVVAPASINFKVGGTYAENVTCIDGKVYDRYSGQRLVKLKYKDGTVRDSDFSSINEFIYDLLYKATQYCNRYGEWNTIGFNVKDVNVIPTENKKYYDKDKDTIATTAGSVRSKVKDGSITSDTDGKVTVKVKTKTTAKAAEGTATAVTPTTKINEEVKVTDISTTLQGVQTMNPGDAITIGSNNIMLNASAYNDKLPFSGLKSISELSDFFLVKSLKDDMPKAPLIPINFTVPVINESIKFDINFAALDSYISLIRLGFAVEFCISMYLSFKKWLMNKEV
ncbi:hypothetical protein [uncultured Eubacterium sp.]|uniref:hypothetical protein n=1 Tax=uncultured Eubacterium sp. TaxID=165185 RepID=UPI0025F5AE99|nr:hypothetical protein [uncultured Eubacterium sp.]